MENVKLIMGEEVGKRENVLKEKSYTFSLSVVRLVIQLQSDKKEFVLTKQLLRSGTSIGANVEEANQAESKADFIHKLSIANKEANETHYWLRLLTDSDLLETTKGEELMSACLELIKILTASIKTSKSKK
jgi:four helix bundle protein